MTSSKVATPLAVLLVVPAEVLELAVVRVQAQLAKSRTILQRLCQQAGTRTPDTPVLTEPGGRKTSD